MHIKTAILDIAQTLAVIILLGAGIVTIPLAILAMIGGRFLDAAIAIMKQGACGCPNSVDRATSVTHFRKDLNATT